VQDLQLLVRRPCPTTRHPPHNLDTTSHKITLKTGRTSARSIPFVIDRHHRSQKERQSAYRARRAQGGLHNTLTFLPPYSPDFNPIEKAFSRLKAMLRKIRERTVNGLWDLIGKLVDIFQPGECANYFSSCGYEPE